MRGLLIEALNTARETLKKEQKKLESLTEALLERETLDDADIRQLWGMEPADTQQRPKPLKDFSGESGNEGKVLPS